MAETKPVIRRSLAESLVSCTAYVGQESEAAAFGRALHSFAAAYVLLCKEAGEESRIGDVEQLGTEAFYRARGLPLGRLPEFLELADRFARTWLAELSTLVAVEETLTYDAGWALLTCTVDRIDRTDAGDRDDEAAEELITDFKAEWTADGDHDFQMWWYVQMRFLTQPALQRCGFQIRLPRRTWQPEPYWFERGELDSWWTSTLAAVREAYEIRQAGRATPTGGVACQYCSKRFTCGAAVSSATVIPENEDQAGELVQDWIRMKAATKEREDALKAFFGDRKPMVVNGLEVGFLSSLEPTPTTSDPDAVVAWLDARSALPLDGGAVLKKAIDWSPIRAYWRELVEGGLAVLPETPVFKARKAQVARQGRKRKKESAATAEPSAPASPRRRATSTTAGKRGSNAAVAAGAGSAVATEQTSLEAALERSLEHARKERR